MFVYLEFVVDATVGAADGWIGAAADSPYAKWLSWKTSFCHLLSILLWFDSSTFSICKPDGYSITWTDLGLALRKLEK